MLHTAGAYGAMMSSNYNSRVLAPEVLLQDGRVHLVRRRQPVEDLVRYDVVPPHPAGAAVSAAAVAVSIYGGDIDTYGGV